MVEMVEKVTGYQFSRRFKKEYNKLPKEIQKTFDEKLARISHELTTAATNTSVLTALCSFGLLDVL